MLSKFGMWMVQSIAVALVAFPAQAQETRPPGKPDTQTQDASRGDPAKLDPELEKLIAQIGARERKARSLRMAMTTSGRLPDGAAFQTSGTLRMLTREAEAGGGSGNAGKQPGPHRFLHVLVRLEVERDGLAAETELLRTPAGAWMREKSPEQGEVITFMKPALVARLEAASAYLDQVSGKSGGDKSGEGSPPPPPPSAAGLSEIPLGSAMLRDLADEFVLELSPARTIDGIDYLVVSGRVRQSPEPLQAEGAPDFVEVLVRKLDLVVTQMRQLQRGEKLLEVALQSMEIDPLIEESSFAPAEVMLRDGRGDLVVDAMEHPPAAAEIEWILRQAKEKGFESADDKAPGGATGGTSSGRRAGAGGDAGKAPVK